MKNRTAYLHTLKNKRTISCTNIMESSRTLVGAKLKNLRKNEVKFMSFFQKQAPRMADHDRKRVIIQPKDESENISTFLSISNLQLSRIKNKAKCGLGRKIQLSGKLSMKACTNTDDFNKFTTMEMDDLESMIAENTKKTKKANLALNFQSRRKKNEEILKKKSKSKSRNSKKRSNSRKRNSKKRKRKTVASMKSKKIFSGKRGRYFSKNAKARTEKEITKVPTHSILKNGSSFLGKSGSRGRVDTSKKVTFNKELSVFRYRTPPPDSKRPFFGKDNGFRPDYFSPKHYVTVVNKEN